MVTYDPTVQHSKRYSVESEFRNAHGVQRVVILQTNDYDKAVQSTNFWDLRQNTYLIDRTPRTIPERIEVLFAQLTIRMTKQLNELWIPDGEHAKARIDRIARELAL